MSEQSSRIIGAVAGVLSAVFLFFSLSVIDPLRQASDSELLAWWSDKSNLDASVMSMYMRLAAVPFFLVFLDQVRSRLRRSSSAEVWSGLVNSTGIIFAVALVISGLARGITAQSININDEPLPGVDVLRFATDLAYEAYALIAITAAALMIGVIAISVLRGKVLASWLGWLGLPIAALSLVAVPFQAGAWVSPLLFIWVLAACVCLVRARDDTAQLDGVVKRQEVRAGEKAPGAAG